jgi:predicted dehydrogenase
MSEKLCRFGILGTAGIARKNWRGIHLSGNATVSAVASRNIASANKFIDECSAQVPQRTRPQAFGSYEELLASDAVDAVYIPLPTALRHEWVIRAAQAGKHILGEKPAALTADLTKDMLEACRKHDVQYMDGVMFMHSARLPMVRDILSSDGMVGQLNRLESHFSFVGDAEFMKHNIRVNSNLEPFGCLGDLGWYCIRAFLWVMNGQLPTEVRGRTLNAIQGVDSPTAVPGAFSGELLFSDKVSASFYCSFLNQNQQWLNLSGSEGYLRLNDFVLPFHGNEVVAYTGNDHFHIDNCDFHMENHLQRHAVREYDAGESSAQEVCMIRNFADLINSGTRSGVWPEWTLKTQKILDACLESSINDGATVKLV